jgi:tRNA uridine 5-carboxymethylaminomethyl modification enzyme
MGNGSKNRIGNMNDKYDVIVVGGGHAGCEAALATARLGHKTLLISINLDYLGWMPCNPAVGGSGKSQVIAEIDALGGEIAVNAEKALSQIRILNTSKGLALRAKRVQCDKRKYAFEMKKTIEKQENLYLYQSVVESLLLQNNQCIGIKDIYREEIYGRTVIVTTGTFLSSAIHVGLISYEAGRAGELNAKNLSRNLSDIGLQVRRFNTGTTPRIDKKTVDFSQLSIQEGLDQPVHFSFKTKPRVFQNQLPSYLGWTNEKTKEVTLSFLKYQPSNTGLMVKVGPRTCPSLEEKTKWFPDRIRHSFFLEAEGYDTDEMYMAGLNMSVFPHCQEKIIQTIKGLENASIIRPAYAIAYDWVDTSELKLTLETKKISHLFLAGQINGTTGYDEAAAQGLIAGINASCLLLNKEPFILNRSESYIGIMVDDLISKVMDEPYRITPSHSEFRLSLREGNADVRLTELGRNIGLVDEERWTCFQEKMFDLKKGKEIIQSELMTPKSETLEKLSLLNFPLIHQAFTLEELLKRPDFNVTMIEKLSPAFQSLPLDVKDELEIESKYEGYIQHENNETSRLKKLFDWLIPESINYNEIVSLSKDGRASLIRREPKTLREASQLPNVKPSDLITIVSYLKNNY